MVQAALYPGPCYTEVGHFSNRKWIKMCVISCISVIGLWSSVAVISYAVWTSVHSFSTPLHLSPLPTYSVCLVIVLHQVVDWDPITVLVLVRSRPTLWSILLASVVFNLSIMMYMPLLIHNKAIIVIIVSTYSQNINFVEITVYYQKNSVSYTGKWSLLSYACVHHTAHTL